MNKIILYEDGPRILSNRFYLILLLIPLFSLCIVAKSNLIILSILLIASFFIIVYSLTSLNSGDAIIIKDNNIFSWNKYVKTRVKKRINISDIEGIRIDEPFLVVKTKNNSEKEYYYNSNQKAIVLQFTDQNQIQVLLSK